MFFIKSNSKNFKNVYVVFFDVSLFSVGKLFGEIELLRRRDNFFFTSRVIELRDKSVLHMSFINMSGLVF